MGNGRLICALLALHALICLALLTSRSVSVARDGAWAQTTGLEGVHVNLILRSSVNISPYHDLSHDATPAIYNFGFYHTYGKVAALSDPHQPVTSTVLRFFTLVIAVIGALVTTVIMGRYCHVPTVSLHSAIPPLVAIGTILGPFAGWWVLTARPDLFAYTMELGGWALADTALRRGRRDWLVAAAACFAVAIAFKQNAVGFLLAVVLVLVWNGRIRDVTPFLLLPLLTIVIGRATQGPYYFQHVLGAVSSTELSLRDGAAQAAQALSVGGGLFLCSLAVAPVVRTAGAPGVPPVVPFVTSAILGVLQLARFGSSRNYLIGAYVAGAAVVLQAATSELRGRRWLVWLLAAGIAYQCMIAASYFVPGSPGRATLPYSPVESLPGRPGSDDTGGPIFTDDAWSSVPWLSGRVGIETLDGTVYPFMVANGLLADTIEARIARRAYSSLFVRDPHFGELALRAGYSRIDLRNGVGWFKITR